MQKDAYYIGFNSEMFWYYPGTNRTYLIGEPTSSTRNGYNFDKNKKIYIPSVRDFFDGAAKEAGLTTYISTLLFAGGNYGATLSKAIFDGTNTMRAVLNWNVIPFSDINNKETLIKKLLFESSSSQFDYLLIDNDQLVENEFDVSTISSNLANMVYAKSNDSSSQKAEKASQIYNTFSIHSITDYKGNKLVYCSFIYSNDQKYIFFKDIKLVKSRSDESSVTESVTNLGFISSSSTINSKLNLIVEELTQSFIKLSLLIFIICLLFLLIVTILSSRYLADFIMDDVIRLCIKIQIAKNTQDRISKMKLHDQNIKFSQNYRDIEKLFDENNKNEIDILYNTIASYIYVLLKIKFLLK